MSLSRRFCSQFVSVECFLQGANNLGRPVMLWLMDVQVNSPVSNSRAQESAEVEEIRVYKTHSSVVSVSDGVW